MTPAEARARREEIDRKNKLIALPAAHIPPRRGLTPYKGLRVPTNIRGER